MGLNVAIINPILRTHNLNLSLFLRGHPPVPTSEIVDINMIELANAIANLGNTVTVYAADDFVEFKKYSLNKRVTVCSVPAELKRIFPTALIPFTPSLANFSRLSEADVIQSAEYFQFHTFFASRLALKNKTPFFVWQEAYRYMRPPALPFQKVFEITAGSSIRSATTQFILRTKKAGNFLREMGFSESSIGPWIPTGIDGSTFKPMPKKLKPEDFGFPKDFRIVLVVARLASGKGIDIAINAISSLRKKGMHVGLLIRGSGPEMGNLKMLATELKIADCVRFLEPRSKMDMAYLYNSSDLFLLSSRTDLFPFAMLEAAGCGLPSVSTQVGCVEDFVENGVTGVLIPPNSVKAMAEGIERALLDETLRTNIGKGARASFIKSYEMNVVAKHLEELYLKSIGG